MMEEKWKNLSEWFWSAYFWLPDGVTWDDFKTEKDVIYADPTEIWIYPIVMSLMLLTFRVYVINPHISKPFAYWLGLKKKTVRAPEPNVTLEKIFAKHRSKVPTPLLESTAKSLGMSSRNVQSWLRRRKRAEKFTKLSRFQDIFYIMIYHVIITVIAVVALYSKPWVYDVNLCFKNYPHHSIDSGLWWLYMIALAFYWSMMFWQLCYPHGKDVAAEMVHHVVTIMLISFSWTGGFFRYGSLILLVHEPTDTPLLLGKLCRYADHHKYTDVLFGIFVVVWFYTRVYLFPFWLLRACFLDMPSSIMSPAVYVQYGFISLLFVLNLLWTIMISKVLIKKLITGEKLDDVRSSDEVSDEDENQGALKAE